MPETAIGIDLRGMNNGNVDMPAPQHRRGINRAVYRPTGAEDNRLSIGVNQPIRRVFVPAVAVSWRKIPSQSAFR